MLVECKNCGAPLAAEARSVIVQCTYCGKRNRVRSMRTLAMERPADWRPPREWTPPDEAKAKSKPLPYRERAKKGSALPPLLMFLTAVGLMVAYGAWVMDYPIVDRVMELFGLEEERGSARGILGGGEPEVLWDGSEPFSCGGADSFVLEGLDVELENRTAIEIAGNCDLTIRDSEIVAWEGITVADRGRLLLERCTIHANEAVIAASGRASVEVVDSELVSAETAITASRRSEIILAGGSVSGSPRAIARNARRHVEVRGAEIHDLVPDGGAHRRRRGRTRLQAEPAMAMAAASPCEAECARKHAECLETSMSSFDRGECDKFDETCRGRCN